jgi:hypothetical protein
MAGGFFAVRGLSSDENGMDSIGQIKAALSFPYFPKITVLPKCDAAAM